MMNDREVPPTTPVLFGSLAPVASSSATSDLASDEQFSKTLDVCSCFTLVYFHWQIFAQNLQKDELKALAILHGLDEGPKSRTKKGWPRYSHFKLYMNFFYCDRLDQVNSCTSYSRAAFKRWYWENFFQCECFVHCKFTVYLSWSSGRPRTLLQKQQQICEIHCFFWLLHTVSPSLCLCCATTYVPRHLFFLFSKTF